MRPKKQIEAVWRNDGFIISITNGYRMISVVGATTSMPLSERTFSRAISPETLALISGRELLIQHLGHWPTFDDFEVLSITLERALVTATVHDLRTTFLVFDLHKAPDDPERKQGLAEFLFESVNDLHIDGFNHQNPITGMGIGPSEPLGDGSRFRVE